MPRLGSGRNEGIADLFAKTAEKSLRTDPSSGQYFSSLFLMDPTILMSGVSALRGVIGLALDLDKWRDDKASFERKLPSSQQGQDQQQQTQQAPQDRGRSNDCWQGGSISFQEQRQREEDDRQRKEKYARRVFTEPRPSSSDPAVDVAASAVVNVISIFLLRGMQKRLGEAEARLEAALNDPSNTNQAKNHEMLIAKCSICVELGRILELNAKKFPDPMFHRLWLSFTCADTAS